MRTLLVWFAISLLSVASARPARSICSVQVLGARELMSLPGSDLVWSSPDLSVMLSGEEEGLRLSSQFKSSKLAVGAAETGIPDYKWYLHDHAHWGAAKLRVGFLGWRKSTDCQWPGESRRSRDNAFEPVHLWRLASGAFPRTKKSSLLVPKARRLAQFGIQLKPGFYEKGEVFPLDDTHFSVTYSSRDEAQSILCLFRVDEIGVEMVSAKVIQTSIETLSKMPGQNVLVIQQGSGTGRQLSFLDYDLKELRSMPDLGTPIAIRNDSVLRIALDGGVDVISAADGSLRHHTFKWPRITDVFRAEDKPLLYCNFASGGSKCVTQFGSRVRLLSFESGYPLELAQVELPANFNRPGTYAAGGISPDGLYFWTYESDHGVFSFHSARTGALLGYLFHANAEKLQISEAHSSVVQITGGYRSRNSRYDISDLINRLR